MPVHLSLSMLGALRVSLDGQPVTGFESNKVRGLLAYLSVEADRPHRREALAALLWPEFLDRAALSNLRYSLSNLRKAIGDREGFAVPDSAKFEDWVVLRREQLHRLMLRGLGRLADHHESCGEYAQAEVYARLATSRCAGRPARSRTTGPGGSGCCCRM